jgi:hypothetical protein
MRLPRQRRDGQGMARIALGESTSAFCLGLAPHNGPVRKMPQRPQPESGRGMFAGWATSISARSPIAAL